MIRYNYHTHTCFSDGKNTPEEMVQEAIALGFRSIGISDHAYTEFCSDWSVSRERIGEYLSTLQELKQKYGGQIAVYAGWEQDALAGPVPEGLDYVIGSVHWLYKNGDYVALDESRKTIKNAIQTHYAGDADRLAEDYFALVSSYAEDPAVSVIGHFDLITKFDETAPALFHPTPRYTAAWEKAAKRLVDAGKIFEINTGAISRGKRLTPYPSGEILKRLGEMGAKGIVSSDCHSKDALACAFDRAEVLARKYKIELVDLF
ncbi:MAG: histidinol-phosphatase [Clostridia bacterium]|nr:histidinol-phosphatase [Clostridia bacterium]